MGECEICLLTHKGMTESTGYLSALCSHPTDTVQAAVPYSVVDAERGSESLVSVVPRARPDLHERNLQFETGADDG